MLRSRTNFVELDFLRGGPRLPVGGLPPCDYYALVSRAERRPRVDIWPWGLRDPMPIILIPLRAGDPDVRLDLKAAPDRINDEQRHARTAFAHPPVPRLAPDDAAWAAQFVPAPSA